MTHIFVSHNTNDDTIVTRLQTALEPLTGREYWTDHDDIQPGIPWDMQVDAALKNADDFLLVLSRNSVHSPEVAKEWRYWLDQRRGRPLYIVSIDDLPSAEIPARLNDIQRIDLYPDWETGIRVLVNHLSKHASLSLDPLPRLVRGRRITGELSTVHTNVVLQGRSQSLETIQSILKTEPVMILAVGGTGKTRLALEIARNWKEVKGAVWHTVTETSTAAQIWLSLQVHFGLRPNTPESQVVNQLDTEPTLIVIDNCESVMMDNPRRKSYVDFVNGLRQRASILLTSRVAWPELKMVKNHKLIPLEHEYATATAIELARVLDIELNEFEAADIALLARNHPGLIEWAVGQRSLFDHDEVISDLRGLKSKDVQDALFEMIGNTLDQMKSSSKDGLKASEALRCLNVTRGGFTKEAAEALCTQIDGNRDDFREWLRILQQWRFLTFDGTRYGIEALVSAAISVDDSAHLAHYNYFVNLARDCESRNDYPALGADLSNLEVAFEWAKALASNVMSPEVQEQGEKSSRLWLFTVIYQVSLHYYNSQTDPSDYALKQYNLGNAYRDLAAVQDREANLSRALDAYRAALTYYTSEIAPKICGDIRNSLGHVYRSLAALENPAENFYAAADSFREALNYYSADKSTIDYAMTVNNLGIAYSDLCSVETPESNLGQAIECYQEALSRLNPKLTPLDFAMVQNNLGTAYTDLSAFGNSTQYLDLAISAYNSALKFYTPAIAPTYYAGVQTNLGNAFRMLSKYREQKTNLDNAISSYLAALDHYTGGQSPLEYAMCQTNLGLAYEEGFDKARALACWQTAEAYFRQLGYEDYAQQVSEWISNIEVH
jgi:tetratricopeptide (TPR) repeat protein